MEIDKVIEEREIRATPYKVVVSEDSRSVEGYALLFDVESTDLGGFTEVIAKGALDGVLEKSDVLAVLNHNPNRGVLARFRKGGGSLSLTIDQKGLKYSFEAPNTEVGNELIEALKRGDIDASSFCFTVEVDKWEERNDHTWLRTVEKIKHLYDVSPVYNEAYKGTTVALRSLEERKQAADAAELEKAKEEQLNNYYVELEKRF